MTISRRVDQAAVSWPLGSSIRPRGVRLRVPWDRTAGVFGPQGSGKSLDFLAHVQTHAPGALLQTSTKPADVLLSVPARTAGGRPVAVCDPFGLLPGLPPLVWDPVAGCVDSMVAAKRARAFGRGTVHGNTKSSSSGDSGARYYAEESAKVLKAYLHAAALTGRDLRHVMDWVAHPTADSTAHDILLRHPDAEPTWAGLLQGTLHGSHDTVANTISTVQQAMDVFMHQATLTRCVPGPGRPATDLAELISAGGTIYLLGKDDPYSSASPLLTAVAEDVLDTAEDLAARTPWLRLAPPFTAALDELPSICPIPSLPQRIADGRARGISITWVAQAWSQLVTAYGEDTARTIRTLTNVLVILGGSKDVKFNQDMSDLIGTVAVERHSYTRGRNNRSHQTSTQDLPALRPHQIGRIPARQAIVLAENAPAITARLTRILDGRTGRDLQRQIADLQATITANHEALPTRHRQAAAAREHARRLGLTLDHHNDPSGAWR